MKKNSYKFQREIPYNVSNEHCLQQIIHIDGISQLAERESNQFRMNSIRIDSNMIQRTETNSH